MKLNLFSQKGPKHGNRLTQKDCILWLTVFSAIFAVMNYRLLLETFAVDVWRAIMSLITLLFWVGMMYSAGKSRFVKVIVAMAVIWGVSLIYGLLNLGSVIDPENMTAVDTARSVGILVSSPFAAATVIALVPGLLFLGYFPGTMAEYIMINLVCMLVFVGCWVIGYRLGTKAEKSETEDYLRKKKTAQPHHQNGDDL